MWAKWFILGVFLFLLLAWIAWPFVDVIIYAIFFYYVARPIKQRLQPYIKNETLLVLTCLFLLILPLFIVVGYTMLLAVNQANMLVRYISDQSLSLGPLSNMGNVVSNIQSQLSPDVLRSGDFTTQLRLWYQHASSILKSTAGIHGILLATGMTFVDVVFKLSLVIIVTFYLLRDDNKLKAWFASVFPAFVTEHDGMLGRYYRAVDEDLEKIFFGNILNIILFAVIAAIVYPEFPVFW